MCLGRLVVGLIMTIKVDVEGASSVPVPGPSRKGGVRHSRKSRCRRPPRVAGRQHQRMAIRPSGVPNRIRAAVAHVFLTVAATCLPIVSSVASVAPGAKVADARFESVPHQVIQEMSEELLELINASRAYVDEEPDRFLAEVDALLSPAIDFQGFSRGVMAAHYRKATADQRRRFADNFKTSLLRTYALSLTSFVDGEVVVLPPDGPPRRANRRNVRMEIHTGKSVHPVIYTMNRNEGGVWRIGNIVVAGVNIGLTFRSQFKSAVADARYGGDIDRVIDAWSGVVAEQAAEQAEDSDT